MDEEAAASDAGREEAEDSGLQLLAPVGADDDGSGRLDASRSKGGGGTRLRWELMRLLVGPGGIPRRTWWREFGSGGDPEVEVERRRGGTNLLGFWVSLYITSEFWIGVFGPSNLNRMV